MKRILIRYKVKPDRAADGSNPLGELASFKAFTAQIRDRCEEAPVPAELTAVGCYRFFGE